MDMNLLKTVPNWVSKAQDPFPSARYQPLLTAAAALKSESKTIIFTVADFDFREMAENWHRFAARAGVTNALVHALDSEACEYLMQKQIPTSNGTASMSSWRQTRLARHIQRALAERFMAAAALVHSGFNALMMDSTAVLVRNPMPFLQTATQDVLAMRGSCKPSRDAAGCEPLWNLLYMRGVDGDAQRTRVLSFVQAGIEKGLVDFYLRWWMGHHCIEMGYLKLYKENKPTLQGGQTREAAAALTDQTSVVQLRRGLSLGLLPTDRFPYAASYPTYKATAMVGRVVRPEKDPKRTHRLRLDRYDDVDFGELVEAMRAKELWLL